MTRLAALAIAAALLWLLAGIVAGLIAGRETGDTGWRDDIDVDSV